MAFGGDFGASGNLIPFALLYSPVYGQAIGYDANGNLQFGKPGNQTVTPARVDELEITAGNGVLGILTDNTDDGSAVDTGVLVSAAAAANEHGLPANFGPGRGNWGTGANDRVRLRCSITTARNSVVAATNVGGPVIRECGSSLANGETSVIIKNMSQVALDSIGLNLRVAHTIQE